MERLLTYLIYMCTCVHTCTPIDTDRQTDTEKGRDRDVDVNTLKQEILVLESF